nr:MAG TPA: hypothetical protein [Caudoviricetes sp.]
MKVRKSLEHFYILFQLNVFYTNCVWFPRINCLV